MSQPSTTQSASGQSKQLSQYGQRVSLSTFCGAPAFLMSVETVDLLFPNLAAISVTR